MSFAGYKNILDELNESSRV